MTAPTAEPGDLAAVDETVAGVGEPAVLVRHVDSAGRFRLILRRFRRNKMSLAGLVIVALMFLLAYVGPSFAHWSYTDHDYESFYVGPNSSHWFGTTQIGGDVYALVLRGLQKSLLIGLMVAVMSTSTAAIVGSCAGYFGGVTDRVLVWIIDLMLVVPAFLILSIMSPIFKGGTWWSFAVLIAVFSWMVTARVVRGYTLTLKSREYVRAARYMGVGPAKIIVRHILPNISSLLIIDATINVGAAVVTESTLSFLGFGIQSPDVSLGTILADGANSAIEHPWLFFFPAAFLVLFVLSVNFIGDGLRDAIDPTSRGGSA